MKPEESARDTPTNIGYLLAILEEERVLCEQVEGNL
jgi:hypothetical protein